MASANKKTCRRCKANLPIAEFNVYGARVAATCRSCANPYLSQRGDTKACAACGEVKPRSEFGVTQGALGPRSRSYCGQCSSAKAMAWRDRNSDRARDSYLRRQYGITLDKYRELLTQQNGVCAICGKLPGETRPDQGRSQGRPVRPLLAVDHDHATGKVRGLLCLPCNRGIGFLEDDIETVRSALKYLEEYS